MASDSTDLYLPPSFPYPIKIISIDAKESSTIQRGARLLSYSFAYLSRSAPPGSQIETRFGTWDAAIEGTVDKWNIKAGDVVDLDKARKKPVVLVTEPCKHGMQLGGLCVLCGKDMTNIDYTGFSDASRASIQMTHSAFGPTVSLEEAQRIERETAKSLLKSRKLSLIVDLDQTIVHATVDPTVGEWIAEGEAWEAQQQRKAAAAGTKEKKKPQESDDTDDDDSDSESDDECNPNWEALKDVKKFRLGPESFQAPSRHPSKSKTSKQTIENEGCMYYIKPRPGWKEFLRDTATKYEMHVYTMGTRAYAEEVCAAIDPDGSIFGGRVLSRDESGSLTQKSLQRLFPCDTSMVVIIDDRADVWEWSPNLIKVIPYDFYVGIGDINSTFLPKVEPLVPPGSGGPSSSSDSKVKPDPSAPAVAPSAISPEATQSKGIPSEPLTATDADQAKLETDAMIRKNSAELEAQLEERPLAKKQEALSEGEPPLHHHHHHHGHEHKDNASETTTGDSGAESNASTPTLVEPESPVQHTEKVIRKALLNNDDAELQRVKMLLDEVHQKFFKSYDASDKKHPSSKEKQPYDVTRIIPQIRTDVLSGIHILFSSVIPLDTRPETTEVWKMAHMFGARCSTELTSEITHVVAAKRGTVKVDTARKRGGIKIVWFQWFQDCIAQWRRLDETSYLLDPEHSHLTAIGSTTPPNDPHQISSDPEPDEDDWDQDPVAPGEHAQGQGLGLELTAINWDDINAEVDEFLNETDDEDDGASVKSDNESVRSTASSATNTPSRKRNRSVTPSSVNGSPRGSDDELRSPLAKRKKLAADRAGYSRLKDSISANEITKKPVNGSSPPSPVTRLDDPMDEDDGDNEEETEEEEEEEEDFLANAFEEEEWG